LFWEDHMQRLRRSASRMEIDVPFSDEWFFESLATLGKAFGENSAYFRIILTRGVIDHVGLDVFEENSKPTVVMLMQTLPANLDERRAKGLKLATASVVRNSPQSQDPNIKTSNYLNCLMALKEVRKK